MLFIFTSRYEETFSFQGPYVTEYPRCYVVSDENYFKTSKYNFSQQLDLLLCRLMQPYVYEHRFCHCIYSCGVTTSSKSMLFSLFAQRAQDPIGDILEIVARLTV